MAIGCLKDDLTKVLYAEYCKLPDSDDYDCNHPYVLVDADQDTRLYSVDDVDPGTIPVQVEEFAEKLEDASKAKMLKRLVRFDDPAETLKGKDLKCIARVFRKIHPLR
jgi:hypothetical protein